MPKKNAYLAKLEADAAAKQAVKTKAHVEIDTIAWLLTIHDELQVGPGRAPRVLDTFLTRKTQIATAMLQELRDDQSKKKEIVVLRRDLAARMKEILGPEGWAKYKTMFPFLRDYW